MPEGADRRPDIKTLLAFSAVVLIGGSNFVAVKLSNRELPPFFGAGVRFTVASLMLFAIAKSTGVRLPRGRNLQGPLVFGLLSFFASYALMYWGLQHVPAALAGLLFGTVPLTTFVLAVLHRIELFKVRALIGAVIAIAGVAVMAGSPGDGTIPVLPFLAVVAATIGASEASVILKVSPPVHPFATNAIAMGVGAVLLLLLSAARGETWIVPQEATTWWTLLFLIPIGSVGLFILFIYVLQRWTASGASYQFVLFPVVSAITAAVLVDEPLNISIAIGAALVIAGTYIGALAPTPVEDSPAEPIDSPPRHLG